MPQPSRTILLVDDSPEDRELYRRYLLRDSEHSYTVLEATLGQQGLDLWQQHQPDIVLLDYRLPDLDGLEFLAQLPSPTLQPCLPVIVVTGQGNEAIAVQAIKAGAQDYLIKGQITPEGLKLAVDGAIAAVELRTQLQQCLERERVVAQITQQIHQSLDLDCILQTTVTEVRQFLHTDRVLVFRLEADGNGTVIAESVGPGWRSLLSCSLYDPCLAENYLRFSQPGSITHDSAFAEDYVRRYRQGLVTAIADIHNGSIDPCHVELLAEFQVQANLVVPILHDDQFWGLLIVHHCAAPRSWQPLEINLLKELATPVGIALRQAELYQQAQAELTERQQVEAELRASEERLRLALQAARMGTWDWHIQTGKITWSANLEAMFGLAPGEFDGSLPMFMERLHPDDRAPLQAAIHRAISTGADYDLEFRVVYPNGQIRWALSQGKVFYDSNGQPTRMAGIDLDITQRKCSQAALQDSEERFRQLAENIDAVFWLREEPEGHISYVSPAYERLWGWQPQELYANQQTWCNHIHPDDRAAVARAFQARAALGQFDAEYRVILDDGSVRWVHDRCFPLCNQAGAIYRFAGIAEDITDRKHAEQALRESEERFRTSVENMLDCFAIYRAVRNQQGEIVDFQAEYINDAACLMSQLTREQHLGRSLCELMPGHRDSGLFAEYCQVVATGQSLVKDGLMFADEVGPQCLTKTFDIRVAKFGDGYVATWRDITDRKQAEESLRQNEQLLRLALAGAQAGSWDWNIPANQIAWSPENFHLYGLEPEQHSPDYADWYNALHPDDRESANAAVLRVVEEKLAEFRAEFRIVHPHRGERWLLALGRLTLDEQSNPLRLSGINLDITDRKQAEETLRRSEERYRLLFESMEDGFCIIEVIFDADANPIDYRFLEINPAFAEQTGLKQAEGKTARQLLPNLEAQWFELYGKVALTGESTRFENGSSVMNRWFEGYAFRIGPPEARKVALLFKEISDRKYAELERDRLFAQEQAARAEAERANRVKDDFLAILSHELRSPLNPILGWAKLMQTRQFDPARTREALATIERNAKLQCQLIDDLLDIARILRGKFSINANPVDLGFVIEAAIETVRTAAVAKSILLQPVLPAIGRVSGDAARLQQIVWNLLSNAIKFTPPQGRVEIRLERQGDQAQLSVSDTGKGINPDFLPHLFESFQQEDVSITRKYGGLGLGLAIVRHLVEAHGGKIWAESPGEGQGATFTLQLPLLDCEPAQSQPDDLPVPVPNLAGIRVLLVDDEVDARELFTVLLTQYEAEVLAVASAAEVLAALESFQPDILVSDIGMPQVDGYALIRQIRTLPPDQGGRLPAIALTAYAREIDSQQAIRCGYQRHITKPVDLDQLVQAVTALTKTPIPYGSGIK